MNGFILYTLWSLLLQVPCVSACVHACVRVLTLEGLSGSLQQLLNGIAGQVSSGMLGLTVGTRIQTPTTDRKTTGEQDRWFRALS